jgi:hypothetical protein
MTFDVEIIGTAATVLAVAGVVLNNRRRRACFAVWLVSNALSCVKTGENEYRQS